MAFQKMLLISLVSIISVTTAQDSIESSSSEIYDYAELGEYLALLEPSCKRLTGSNETYSQLVINSVYVPLYLTRHIDVKSFSIDLQNLTDTNRAEFFPKYCPQLHASLSVLEPVTTELRKCLDPEEVAVLDIIITMLPEGINLACKDNGQIFFMNDSNGCSGKFVGYVKNCGRKISKTTEAVDLSNYGPKQCDELALVRECLKQQLTECEAPRLMDIFDLFYRPVVQATPCEIPFN